MPRLTHAQRTTLVERAALIVLLVAQLAWFVVLVRIIVRTVRWASEG